MIVRNFPVFKRHIEVNPKTKYIFANIIALSFANMTADNKNRKLDIFSLAVAKKLNCTKKTNRIYLISTRLSFTSKEVIPNLLKAMFSGYRGKKNKYSLKRVQAHTSACKLDNDMEDRLGRGREIFVFQLRMIIVHWSLFNAFSFTFESLLQSHYKAWKLILNFIKFDINILSILTIFPSPPSTELD